MVEIVNKPATAGITKRSPFKKQECNDSRDSLAKSLYDNLFNWLVERMNLTIIPESFEDPSFERTTKTIGLLDIFGFECFAENNFEQMCINYVNEKLHKLYISAIFDAEKFELKMEGLEEKVNSLKYPDLTSLDVIRLMDEKLVTAAKGAPQGKIGLFNIVNDFSTSTTVKKWEQLKDDFDKAHHSTAPDAIYTKEKARDKFKIRHSAKDVIYTVKTFIDRNKDNLSASLENAIIEKGDPLIAKIFQGLVKDAPPQI